MCEHIYNYDHVMTRTYNDHDHRAYEFAYEFAAPILPKINIDLCDVREYTSVLSVGGGELPKNTPNSRVFQRKGKDRVE